MTSPAPVGPTETAAINCFTPGTRIATPRGETPVESLRPGDLVITRDRGLQPVRWIGRRILDAATLLRNAHLRPVLIRRGSLGHDLPERDLIVSPNHRILVTNDRTALYFDEHEVLVAAKHLVGVIGAVPETPRGVIYVHFMCDRHEVVLSEGAWSESFQPGDESLGARGNAQRNELFDLFPALQSPEGLKPYGAARRILKRHEALLLAPN